MSVEREYASKAVAGTGLGTGIAGTVTGVSAAIMSIISLLNDGKKDQAASVAATAGISMAEVMMMMTIMNGKSQGICEAAPIMECGCFEETAATHFELQQAEIIGHKDAEIAQLKADGKTDEKIIAFNESVSQRFGVVGDKFDVIFKQMSDNAVAAAKAECKADYLEREVVKQGGLIERNTKDLSDQAVYNGVNNERIGCIGRTLQGLQNEVAGFTRTVIPSGNVADSPLSDDMTKLIAAIKDLG
ncbi:MAG: hypothetical protein R3Y58_01915 [Eubacteriales bacterium]